MSNISMEHPTIISITYDSNADEIIGLADNSSLYRYNFISKEWYKV